MDINRVREGAVLICPVKVPGGGIYLGDMHAMQGDGEIAGHTTDVFGIVSSGACHHPNNLVSQQMFHGADLVILAAPISVHNFFGVMD